MSERNKVANKWDPLVRFSHWLMVLLIGVCWYTAENGQMQWHYYSGYALLATVLIRIVWGFIGTKPARFSSFVQSPKSVFKYLQTIRSSQNSDNSTHSPAGGYSVLALIALMLTQTITGLFAVETDGFDGGPLSEMIDYDLSLQVSEIHQASFDVLLVFIGLHILAVGFYQFVLKQKLIQKMGIFK